MEPQPNELKALRIMFFAMLIGQILFGLIVTVLVETGIMSNGMDDMVSIFRIGLILIIAACIPASFVLFRKRLTEINPEEDLGSRIEKYRAALIMRMALCEGPSLFASICYFITGNRFFLCIIILLVINFLLIYPSREKIINELQLSSGEQSAFGMD